MHKIRIARLTVLLLLITMPLGAYTVYLNDGAQLIAREPPEIRETPRSSRCKTEPNPPLRPQRSIWNEPVRRTRPK